MSKILMILKTQNLRNDQRVLKEMKSLTDEGANVNVFVSKNCDTTEEELGYPMKEINIIGGAAPKNTLIRMIGVVVFYIKCMFYLAFRRKKFDKVWICDPIMFGLVLLIKLFFPKIKVIWDHHELPPKWFISNKVLMSMFAKAYQKSDIIIHANRSRCDYLEENLKIVAQKKFIISNYPASVNSVATELDEKSMEWLEKNPKFIYLQNSLQDNRFGSTVIKKLIDKEIPVFHAGKIDHEYMQKHGLISDFLYTAGYLSFQQINFILKNCTGTIILYKQDSLNQIYCDANRLYQAMSLGVPILIGDNPTLIETSTNYRDKLIWKNENIEILDECLSVFVEKFSDKKKVGDMSPEAFLWSDYNKDFDYINRS